MANAKILKKYLVDEDKGYLLDKNNNGKVIMLSGKWGSGKTHFWQKEIQTVLENKDKKIPNHYVSLYGKTSIQEIKNEVFLKIFESMDIFKIDEKSFGLAKDTANLITDITKSVSVFGFNLDLSKIVDKSFEKLEKVKEEKKEQDIKNTLNSGAIICFDDFERKSKDIDLNDLFGFITNLTIEFNCKVVIILNDDVFEGEEKKIFSNVKEKSVSKFLKYEPSIKELFETIFSIERYRVLDKHKEIILNTIEETEELNARIYIQVLDNLVEWIKNQDKSDEVLRCLILVNVMFINFHKIVFLEEYKIYSHVIDLNSDERKYDLRKRLSMNGLPEYFVKLCREQIKSNLTYLKKYPIKEELFYTLLKEDEKKVVNEYSKELEVLYFAYTLNIEKNINIGTFQKINNFIETGILINE